MHDTEAPELPPLHDAEGAEVEWHAQTVAWWADVWASPMAPEYDDSDRHGLFLLATLVDTFWRKPSTKLAGEIRMQRQAFGLSPLDRRRLQWEIERGESADEKRRAKAEAKPKAAPKADPRRMLAG